MRKYQTGEYNVRGVLLDRGALGICLLHEMMTSVGFLF